jgi:hypothetical protein
LQLLSPPLNGTDRAFQHCVTRPCPPFGDEFLNGFLAPTDCVLALVPHAWLRIEVKGAICVKAAFPVLSQRLQLPDVGDLLTASRRESLACRFGAGSGTLRVGPALLRDDARRELNRPANVNSVRKHARRQYAVVARQVPGTRSSPPAAAYIVNARAEQQKVTHCNAQCFRSVQANTGMLRLALYPQRCESHCPGVFQSFMCIR